MIVDSSALVAAFRNEHESGPILKALFDESGTIPAPVVLEFMRVATQRGSTPAGPARAFLDELLAGRLSVVPFTAEDADLAIAANQAYGAGNGSGGRLNLLDLMVYAVARRAGRPILFTGSDFAATDALIHPASRLG